MERANMTQLSSNQKTSDLSEYLVIGVISSFVAWYLSYLWRRRHLYLSSIQLQGPFALPIVGSAFSLIGNSTDPMELLSHMCNIYPRIFRIWIGTRLVYTLSDPKYIEILLSSPHALEKAFFYRLFEPVLGKGLLTSPVSRWRKSRKIINPTFNQKILDKFMDTLVKYSKVVIEVMQNTSARGEYIDISTSMSRLNLSSFIETAMGLQLDKQVIDPDLPLWIKRLSEIGIERAANILYHSDFIFARSALGKEVQTLGNKLKSLASKVITERRSQMDKNIQEYVDTDSSKIKPFLDLLLELQQKNNDCFTDDELFDETLNFLLAATDTTSFAECATLTMLGMHQDVQEKVLAEVLEVIGPDRDVSSADLSRLHYMERVVKETLRLFPAAPFIGRQVDENIDLGDCVIQKGTSVIVGILDMHRNEKYWPEPLKFDPDRFLAEEIAKRPSGFHIPFSSGPRNCIGIRYAMMSIKVLLATLLRKYRVYTSYEHVEDIKLRKHFVLHLEDGHKISLELRK